ncbi:MAG: protein tyrosine phosphatase family protein [Desulfobacterium sp.]|nr:protein tyrosine phosphatase family protein [Desulfobacterium sp.]
MLNTAKTTLGFFGSLIRKYTPLQYKENSVEDIFNYLNINDTLSCSGQPGKNQFPLIQKAGYDVIINLAPYEFIESPLKDEEAIVTELGMGYIHIPVNFFNPTTEDFDMFVDTMQGAWDKKVWVHCAANARASSFVYRYRCSILGEDRQAVIWDLREIWEPAGPWKTFVFDEKPIH